MYQNIIAIEANNFKVAEILAKAGASCIADEGRIAKLLCSIGFENDLDKLRFLVQTDCNIE